MGKSDILGIGSKDRSKWPIQARVSEKIYLIGKKLKKIGLMDDYMSGKISLSDVEILLQEHDNSNIIQDVIDLSKVCSEMLHLDKPSKETINISTVFKGLEKLGIALDTEWWERYQKIADTMGTDCVLSIRTAVQFLDKDPKAGEIKKLLQELIQEV